MKLLYEPSFPALGLLVGQLVGRSDRLDGRSVNFPKRSGSYTTMLLKVLSKGISLRQCLFIKIINNDENFNLFLVNLAKLVSSKHFKRLNE